MKKKFLTLAAMTFGGSTLFQLGCLNLNDFWGGFFNTGWPVGNQWLNITIDVLMEELLG